ncbi:glycosyltransferase [Polynucleobacter sp. KF022]|uniref:MraY family glycosyltransferase n=1 Tax=Polynucleobacter sp. KF022 TaxID=2982615 RepID=UPI0024935730|nr:glycosyltransferase [Polynucleobacter sp. KF022]
MIIRFKHLHEQYSGDRDLSGPQKFHNSVVPRIGGISIAFGIVAGTLIKASNIGPGYIGLTLIVCAIPAFAIGLTEDLTKKISVRHRLLLTAVSASCVIYLLRIEVVSLGDPLLNLLFTIPFFGIIFTVFAITGLANAYNIIDGFNGLSSMVGVITLLAITYVGYHVSDATIIFLAIVMAAAILGFFIWNYPNGLIFLGDGGAYLIGFWIACLSILLCFRNPTVSPWFALLINGYPIMETLFSIYRRRVHQKKSPGAPDGIHFHTLIYRRILHAKHFNSTFSANARTAPYLWLLAGLSVTPAVLWWQSTHILMGAYALFVISYVWIYSRIVKFKTPKWMRT